MHPKVGLEADFFCVWKSEPLGKCYMTKLTVALKKIADPGKSDLAIDLRGRDVSDAANTTAHGQLQTTNMTKNGPAKNILSKQDLEK